MQPLFRQPDKCALIFICFAAVGPWRTRVGTSASLCLLRSDAGPFWKPIPSAVLSHGRRLVMKRPAAKCLYAVTSGRSVRRRSVSAFPAITAAEINNHFRALNSPHCAESLLSSKCKAPPLSHSLLHTQSTHTHSHTHVHQFYVHPSRGSREEGLQPASCLLLRKALV